MARWRMGRCTGVVGRVNPCCHICGALEHVRERSGYGPTYRSASRPSSMMTTRWSSTGSATCLTAHVSPPRTRVSPMWGTRSVTVYSQSPVGKRMVIDSRATGRLSPLDLARCQVGTAGGRAVGGDSRVAELVPFETLCSSEATVTAVAALCSELDEPFAHAPLVGPAER